MLLLNNCGEIVLLKQINKELVGSEIKLKSKIIEEHCIVIVDRATGENVDWITCYFIEIGDDGGGGGTTNDPGSSNTPPEVTLDPSFQNTKAECVYNKLISSNLMENLLQDFMGSDRYNITYEVVPKLIGSSGEPAYGKCFHNPDGSLTIKINSYYFDKVAPVHLANTILHETIHAYLFRKVDEIGGLSNLSEENFERLFAYYKTYGAIDYQHDYISQFYIDDMASTLRQFDQNKYSTDYYEALSWSGLHYTYGWQIMTENQKNEIRNKVEIINSGTKDCK